MSPPLVRAPSIHLSFNLAAVLPGGRLIALAAPLRSQGSQRLVDIVYGVDYQGYLNLAPTLLRLSVSISPGGRLRHGVPSYIYAFHRYTGNSTTLYRTLAQWFWMQFRVEPGISPSNLKQITRFTPSNSINACTLRITAAAGTKLAGAKHSVGNVKTARY